MREAEARLRAESELENSKKRVSELEIELDEQSSALNASWEDMGRLEQELEETRGRARSLEVQVGTSGELQQRLLSAHNEVQQLTQKLNQQQSEAHNAAVELERSKQERTQLESRLHKAQAPRHSWRLAALNSSNRQSQMRYIGQLLYQYCIEESAHE